jgi:mannitol operon transcriptional antiterminator
MKRRIEEILRLLAGSSGYTTIERIAAHTDAGVRTIHRDLETLERSLGLRGVRLERRRGFGVRLLDPLPESLLIRGLGSNVSGGMESPERPLMILLYLIIAGDWTKISELAHVFFVSDSSISSDLNGLEPLLPDTLYIERHKGVGVRLRGDELTRRLIYLAVFPVLLPLYLLDSDSYRRVVRSLHLLEEREEIMKLIGETERHLGFALSPAYTSMVFGYLFLLRRRLRESSEQLLLPGFALPLPNPFFETARLIGESLVDGNPPVNSEVILLGHVLASCEVTAPPTGQILRLTGSLSPAIQTVVERTLGILEEQERTWLHDDRSLLDYLRMTLSAAARRLDLGTPHWREFLFGPLAIAESAPEGTALTREFCSGFETLLPDLSPGLVQRELGEAIRALGARLESIHRRRAAHMSVRILCYEGLGMSSYLQALGREVLPSGARIDSRWDPDFANSPEPGNYDLVVSTYPLRTGETPLLVIDSEASPEEIRSALREKVMEVAQAKQIPGEPDRLDVTQAAMYDGQGISLPAIMAVSQGFFVVPRKVEVPLLDQVVSQVDRGDCDPVVLRQDFERRESYGSLIFDEVGVRLVHCRSAAVPEPRAGIIQHSENDLTIMVLAAPVSAPPEETRVLSELVIALTDAPGFSDILARENRETIQKRILELFSRTIG